MSRLVRQADENGDPGLVDELGDEIRVTLQRWSVGQLGLADLVTAAVVVGAGAVVAWLLSRMVRRYARRLDGNARDALVTLGLIMATGVVLVSVALAMEVLGFSLGPILVMILIALVILLLTRPLLTNLSSGLLLHLRAALESGDLVLTNGVLGTVHEVNARSVVIDTADGRRVHVPNTDVAESRIANYTARGRRRSAVDLMVDHRVDLSALLPLIVTEVAGSGAVLDKPAPEVRIAELRGRFVVIRILVWHKPSNTERNDAVSATALSAIAVCRREGIALDGPDLVAVPDVTRDGEAPIDLDR